MSASKTPVIYVHGILGNADFWPKILPARLLSNGGTSISLPGHSTRLAKNTFGREQKGPSRPFHELDFCAAIHAAIDSLYAGTPVDLVGWSTGGFAALMAASSYPEKIRRVVSVSGFARGAWSGGLGNIQSLAAWAATRWLVTLGLRTASSLPRLFDRLMTQMCARQRVAEFSERQAISSIARGLRFHNMDAVVSAMSDIRGFDITNRLSQIQCPVLVISGTHDPIIPHAEARHLASNLKNCRLVELENSGHLFFEEARDQTFSVIEQWLQITKDPDD